MPGRFTDMLLTAKFRACSVSPQVLMYSLSTANQGVSLHRMTIGVRENGVRNRCPSVSTMWGRYWNSVLASLLERILVVFASPCGCRGRHWISVSGPYRQQGGWLPRPCLPTPFPIPRDKEIEGFGMLAQNLPGIRSEFAQNLLGTQNSLGKRPRPTMRGTLHFWPSAHRDLDARMLPISHSQRLGSEKSAWSSSARRFSCTPSVVMDVRAFGIICTHMLVFQGFEGLPEVFFNRDVRTNDPGTSAGYLAWKMRTKIWSPPPEFLSKDFPSATRSRTEILTKENLVGTKTAPTAISRTLTPSVRRIRFP